MKTLVPASRIARSGVGVLTTVQRTRIAQSSHVAVPEATTMRSL